MSYRVLITGGGSKLGEQLVDRFLEKGYMVDVLTSKTIDKPNVRCATIDWNSADYNTLCVKLNLFKSDNTVYDYIIVNHNSGNGYNGDKYGKMHKDDHIRWSKDFFISCQSYDIILSQLKYKIKENTKVISFLSGVIQNIDSPITTYFSGYSGIKSYIRYMMNGYAKYLEGVYIMINPGHMDTDEAYNTNSKMLIGTILKLTNNNNGEYLNITGEKIQYTI